MFQPRPFRPGSIHEVLHDYADYLIKRSDFPEADPTLGGNPGWCPVTLTKLVLLQRHHGWSEREAARRAKMDMEVKACLNLGLEQPGPSQPTLSRHARRMQELGLDEVYLQRLIDLLQALELITKYEPVLVDSVPIHGAGQQMDSYNLLAGTVRQGLRALAKAQNRPIEEVAAEHDLRAYLDRSIKGHFDIDWSEKSARVAFLAQLVADARRVQMLLEQADVDPTEYDDDPKPPASTQALEDAHAAIEDIVTHDVEFSEAGEVCGLRQQPGGDRRISITDPDMRHGRKSASQLITGFKAQIVSSLLYGFILIVEVIAANRADGEELPELVGEAQSLGHEPAWWGGDHAYGTLANHRHFRDNDCGELIARMARPCNGGRFTKDMFDYDFDEHVLTCPAGQTATKPRFKTVRGQIGRMFKFSPEQCGGCPHREQCVSPQAASQRRSVFIVDDDERLIRDHLQQRETPAFRDRLAKRIRVEHAIAGFAQCGGKQAQRFGMDNVSFDARLSAITYNLRRLGSLLRANADLRARLDEVVAAFLRFLHGLLAWRTIKRWLSAPTARLQA